MSKDLFDSRDYTDIYVKMANEKVFYPQVILSAVNVILEDSNSDKVINACFQVLEDGVYGRVVNHLNAFFVEEIEHPSRARYLKKDQREFNESKIVELENKILAISGDRDLSFGEYLGGLRLFLSLSSLTKLLENMDIPFPKWSESIKGEDSRESAAIADLYHYSLMIEEAARFGIPSEKIRSYLNLKVNKNDIKQKKVSWNDVLSRIITMRNEKSHSKTNGWWRSDSAFTALIKDLIAPFTLALIQHKSWSYLIQLECAQIQSLQPDQAGLCQVLRVDVHKDLINPRSYVRFDLLRPSERLKEGDRILIEGAKSLGEVEFKPVLSSWRKFPSVDNQVWNERYNFLLLYLYLRDGLISTEEQELLSTIESKWPISLERLKAQPPRKEKVTRDAKVRANLILQIEEFFPIEDHQEALVEFYTQLVPSLSSRSSQDFQVFKRSLCDALKLMLLSDNKEEQDFETFLITSLSSDELQLDALIELTQRLPRIQSDFLRDHLVNANGVLRVHEIANQFKLPQELIKGRLKALVDGSLNSSEGGHSIQIVEVDEGYTTKDLSLIARFAETLNAASSAFKELGGAPPPYALDLLEIAAEYIRNEDHNHIWIDRVGAIQRRYTSQLPNIKLVFFMNKLDGSGSEEYIADSTLPDELVKQALTPLVSHGAMTTLKEWRLIGDRLLLRRLKKGEKPHEDMELVKVHDLHQFEINRALDAHEFAYSLGSMISTKFFNEMREVKVDRDIIDLPKVPHLSAEDTLDPEAKAYRPGRAQIHLRLSLMHDGKVYEVLKREDSLTMLYASLLYTLDISRGWLDSIKDIKQRARIESSALFTYQEHEKYIPDESLWASYEKKLSRQRDDAELNQAHSWPILTGRVRCMFNSIPFHISGSPFVSPRLYRLGAEYDIETKKQTRAPIDYYFDVNGTAADHVNQVIELCARFDITVQEVEFYPTIVFQGARYSFADESRRVQTFIDYLSAILKDYHPSTQKDLYNKESSTPAWYAPGKDKCNKVNRRYLLAVEQKHFEEPGFEAKAFENGVMVGMRAQDGGVSQSFYVDQTYLESDMDVKLIESLHVLLFDDVCVEFEYTSTAKQEGITPESDPLLYEQKDHTSEEVEEPLSAQHTMEES